LREAARLGFGRALVPRIGGPPGGRDEPALEVIEVATLRDAVEIALGSRADHRGDALPAMLG
jgi:predicted ATP-dependent serine protease